MPRRRSAPVLPLPRRSLTHGPFGIDIQRYQVELETSLREYDRRKVLPAWDALLQRQQEVMENLGVPAMFQTTDKTERSRQQRLIRVMEDGLSEESL